MTIQTEAVIIGAGPCGLFQVFELGLQGIKAHLVDALPEIGGQCIALYPDKPIYDIPAIRECRAAELIERLLDQIEPFEPTFHLHQQVTTIVPTDDQKYLLTTSKGTIFVTPHIIIAGGVGSFQPMPLRAEGVETLSPNQLHYRVQDPSIFKNQKIVILGGGDSALDWTVELVSVAQSLTLIHRSDNFRAAQATVAQMRDCVNNGQMEFYVGNTTRVIHTDGSLEQIEIIQPDRQQLIFDADHLLVFFGLSPKLGPIAEWGLNITRNQIETNTETYETNIPGIYAVGDIATYPGKKKLILSGFHEAALVAFAINQRLNPGKKIHLQYTTTSSLMHERLGVQPDE